MTRARCAREEVAIVVAGQEARFLALGSARRGEAGGLRLGTNLGLRVGPEREVDAVEPRRIDRREHVGLVLGGVGAPRDKTHSVAFGDARVVACPEHVGADPLRECDERVEPKSPVAAHARVRREAGGVAVDERLHDGLPERFAHVEGDVREAEGMASLACPDHGVRGAACALRARAGRVEPETERHPDRVRPRAVEGHGAVDASAHRNGDATGSRRGADDRRKRVRESVRCKRLTRNCCGLEQGQPDERPRHPVRVGLDDPVALDDETRDRVPIAARGVSDQLEGHRSRLAPSSQTRNRGLRPQQDGARPVGWMPRAASRSWHVSTSPNLPQGHSRVPDATLSVEPCRGSHEFVPSVRWNAVAHRHRGLAATTSRSIDGVRHRAGSMRGLGEPAETGSPSVG